MSICLIVQDGVGGTSAIGVAVVVGPLIYGIMLETQEMVNI